jgi:hypothetical protein
MRDEYSHAGLATAHKQNCSGGRCVSPLVRIPVSGLMLNVQRRRLGRLTRQDSLQRLHIYPLYWRDVSHFEYPKGSKTGPKDFNVCVIVNLVILMVPPQWTKSRFCKEGLGPPVRNASRRCLVILFRSVYS